MRLPSLSIFIKTSYGFSAPVPLTAGERTKKNTQVISLPGCAVGQTEEKRVFLITGSHGDYEDDGSHDSVIRNRLDAGLT